MECYLKNNWDINNLNEAMSDEFLDHADVCPYHADLLDRYNEQILPEIQKVLSEFVISDPTVFINKREFYTIFLIELMFEINKYGSAKIRNLLRALPRLVFSNFAGLTSALAIVILIGTTNNVNDREVNRGQGVVSDFTNVSADKSPIVNSIVANPKTVEITTRPTQPKHSQQQVMTIRKKRTKGQVSVSVQEQSVEENQLNKLPPSESAKPESPATEKAPVTASTPSIEKKVDSAILSEQKTPTESPDFSANDRTFKNQLVSGRVNLVVKINNLQPKDYSLTKCEIYQGFGENLLINKSTSILNGTCGWTIENNKTYTIKILHPNFETLTKTIETGTKVTSYLQYNLVKKTY
jgi:hypothetical protein